MIDAMTELPETAISRAVRADADAARAQIRAAGFICPSCGTNMADLPADHGYEFSSGDFGSFLSGYGTARCGSGETVTAAGLDFEASRSLVNIDLWDKVRAAEDAALFGTGSKQ